MQHIPMPTHTPAHTPLTHHPHTRTHPARCPPWARAPAQVCPFSGLVLVGHAGGEVRLYQFTDSKQTVHRMNLDESGVPYDNVAAQVGRARRALEI